MKEYCFIDTIFEKRPTQGGQLAGVLKPELAIKALNEKAAEGWRVHTYFHDDRGTVLMERDTEKTIDVLLKDQCALLHEIRTKSFNLVEQQAKQTSVIASAVKYFQMTWRERRKFKKQAKSLQ